MPPRVRPPAPLQHQMHAWRKHRKMTLQQVADAIGSSKGHLSQIENGIRDPTAAVSAAVAALFGIEVEVLLRRRPGEDTDLEADLLALFRGMSDKGRTAIVDSARVIARMDRGE